MDATERPSSVFVPLLAAAVAPVAAALAAETSSTQEQAFLVGTVVVDVILLAAYLLTLRRDALRHLRTAVSKDTLWQGPLAGLVALTAAVAAGALGRAMGFSESVTVTVAAPAAWFLWAVGVSRFVVGPLIEELFYRGLLLERLGPRFGGWAVGIQGVAFAFAHFRSFESPDVLTMLSAGAVGLVLGAAVHRWGRVGPAIVGHVLVNAA